MTPSCADRVPIAIIGGSGYGGGELLRLLLTHPAYSVVSVVSRSHGGSPISSVHSHLAGLTDLRFDVGLALEELRGAPRSAIFVTVPHGQSVRVISDLLDQGLPSECVVIDLSGDLRLRDEAAHAKYYGDVPYASALRKQFVYGLPELHREAIIGAKRIANPGCLATAAILSLLPATGNGYVGPVVIDAKTGTSGAGREPQTVVHHPTRFSDFTAYKVLEHRHEAEIAQAIDDPSGAKTPTMFVPHLLPVSRGILVTCYLTTSSTQQALTLIDRYRTYYSSHPFVRVNDAPPRLINVVGTNFCDLYVTARGAQIVAMTALDNLGKGMAGQAIQNLNISLELPETTGLLQCALGPA